MNTQHWQAVFLFSFLILLQAASPFANAQRSTSSVMDVSVRVITPNLVSVVPVAAPLLVYDKAGHIKGELGSVAIKRSDSNQMIIKTQKNLELVNEKGVRILFPVGVNQRDRNESTNVEFKTQRAGINATNPHGTFTGTMTTKIEYL